MTAKLTPNWTKIVEAVLYLIGKSNQDGRLLTQYQIVKALFIADDKHLQDYGRPVTYSNYVAMEFGPVASEAYDLLKEDFDWSRIGQTCPWTRVPAKNVAQTAMNYHLQDRHPNLKVLSRSDQRVLDEALEYVTTNDFKTIKDLTHSHPAYANAWKDGKAKSYKMSYLDMIPDRDPEHLSELVYASKHM